MDQIVKSVPGVFSFIGSDGKQLRDLAMELNDSWAMYVVKRNGDKAMLSELEDTVEKIKREGIDRQSMAALESLTDLGPLSSRYPVNSYTIKPSQTNSKVACEEVANRMVTIFRSMMKRLMELIRAAIKLIKERLPMFFNRREKVKEDLEKRLASPKPTEFMTEQEIEANENLSAEAAALTESYNEQIDRLSDSGDRLAMEYHMMVGGLTDYITRAADTTEEISKLVAKAKGGQDVTDAELDKLPGESDFDIPEINKFAKHLGTQVDNNLDASRVINDWFAISREKNVDFNPYQFESIAKRLKTLEVVLNNEQGPMIFPERMLTELTRLTSGMESSSEGISKLIDQAERRESTVKINYEPLFKAVSGIEKLYRAVVNVINFGEKNYEDAFKFYRVWDDWLRKVAKK